jgi:hypothetical protein
VSIPYNHQGLSSFPGQSIPKSSCFCPSWSLHREFRNPFEPGKTESSQPVSNAQQSPKLLTQVRNKMRLLHDSIRTESAYVDWIVRFRRVLRIRRCAPLSFSIDRCSNWIRVVWMEYGPGGRSGCPSCCHMRKFEGSLTLVRRAVWCDSSADCFTAPGCDCWKFAGCESKTSTLGSIPNCVRTATAHRREELPKWT